MRGHQPLIAMRMRGLCPTSAWLTLGTDPLKTWRDWPLMNPPLANIEINDREALSSLPPQLRCLVGMVVVIDGEEPDRTLAVAQMALDAGAKRVFATFTDPETRQRAGVFHTEENQQWVDF